ncbi:MAG: YbbR-like domain-containing protein [Candidatus Omnitrophica bacterium]|nr:YbbR-like domain-containing protein [Candidatus Omnitrophota bacterium]
MKIKNKLLNNMGFKALALFFALATWFYVGEANKEDTSKTAFEKIFMPKNYMAKTLFVKPVFIGKVPEGYRLIDQKLEISPGNVLVVAPVKILSRKEFIYTEPIDLSEYTKTKLLNVGLRSFSSSVKVESATVRVLLPIEKNREE